MIHVIATIQLQAGARDAFLAEFRKLMPHVLAEHGCLEYGPTIDAPTSVGVQGDPRPDVVTVIEKWESVDALESHLIAQHMKEFRRSVKELVDSISLQILEPA